MERAGKKGNKGGRGKGGKHGKGGKAHDGGPNTTGEVSVVRTPRPAVGSGQDMTRELLRGHWQSMGPRRDIVDFYGHNANMGDWAVFSNFYDQSRCPFDFVVPLAFCACDLEPERRIVRCDFSEKAIMLCKAAAMGDEIIYHEIARATTPATCKKLGRQVTGFDGDVWAKIECSVAFHVVHQKFAKTPSLRKILLEQSGLYAEMTKNDANWGTGVDWDDPKAKDPSKWPGTNMLGWALNEARSALLAGYDAAHFESLLAVQEEEIMGLPSAAPEVPPRGDTPAVKSKGSKETAATPTEGASSKVDSQPQALQQSAKSVFRCVTGVLNEAFPESDVEKYKDDVACWSSASLSFAAACDALASAIEVDLVPPQGLNVLADLACLLPDHGVPDSARLPRALAAKGFNMKGSNDDGPSDKTVGKRWGPKR